MKELLPESLYACVDLLKPYFVISFGSFTRMDYGTGHEAAFGILLMCLTLIRFFHPEPAEERSIVLIVFLRYIRLCWKLQDTYRLEPAGSHGVWGLDDYVFLSYIFGSAQLRGRPSLQFMVPRADTVSLFRRERDSSHSCPASTPASDEPILHVDRAHPRSQIWTIP